MANRQLTLNQFATELRQWYDIFEQSNPKYFLLEDRISLKAIRQGHLDIEDVIDIVKWGGNPHGLSGLVRRHNTESHVVAKTGEAITMLSNPVSALSNLRCIKYLGLAFATKTLRCLCPQNYGVLDSKVRQCLDVSLLPNIRDETALFCHFLGLLRKLKETVSTPGPSRRPKREWFIADIEMALFQFAWQGNKLV